MVSQYIDIIIAYLSAHSDFFSIYFPIFVFLAALIESTPFLGTLTPGTLLLLFFGFSAYTLNINLSLMVLAATIGSIMGDMLGYYLGKHGSSFLLKHKKILKLSHIEDGRKFFSNHGVKSIFIGRFVGPIRPILPLIAGSISMKFSKFMYYNIAASFLWSLCYMTIGFFFGSHFREIEGYITKTGFIITLIVVLIIGVYYFKFRKNKHNKIHEDSETIQS